MADETGINRISLRVPAEFFDKLDKKRFEEKTTFQQIGLQLLEDWFSGERTAVASENTDGEFVKCPTRIRPVIQTAIARLLEMDPKDLPAMERLIVRFSEPGYIETILEDNAKTALRPGPQPVPPKAKGR